MIGNATSLIERVTNLRNLLIVDLESTCYENEPPHFFSEIIEIGAVVFDPASLEVIGEFQRFVKPMLFPILSDFCKQLTSITQEQVDGGVSIDQALKEIGAFARKYDAVFCSWGYYDRKQIERVCLRFSIPYPFQKAHISLKHEHSAFYGIKKLGLGQALRFHGFTLEGTHHRAIDDARNIAKITRQMIQDGWRNVDWM